MTRYKVEYYLDDNELPTCSWEGDAEGAKDARERANYMIDAARFKNLTKVTISVIEKRVKPLSVQPPSND